MKGRYPFMTHSQDLQRYESFSCVKIKNYFKSFRLKGDKDQQERENS